ncbi:NINE protein, partial [Staphylococcus epidermidis]
MKVNKTIYIIVALILGGLGVHKFYADQVGQGILH